MDSPYYTVERGCPWYAWDRPNVIWCESYVCSYVVTPANTWSNLAYIIAAYFMHLKLKGRSDKIVWMFVPGMIMTGVTSFAFHASVTRFFQIFDFFGMFSFTALAVVLNFKRAGVELDRSGLLRAYTLAIIFCMLAIPIFEYVLSLPIQATVVSIATTQIMQEVYLRFGYYRRHPQLRPSYRRFLQSIGLLAAALACSVADVTRFYCDPSNHIIQGHAIWHLLSALGLYSLFLFYCSMDFDNVGEGTPL